jgi:hypothetical protein
MIRAWKERVFARARPENGPFHGVFPATARLVARSERRAAPTGREAAPR